MGETFTFKYLSQFAVIYFMTQNELLPRNIEHMNARTYSYRLTLGEEESWIYQGHPWYSRYARDLDCYIYMVKVGNPKEIYVSHFIERKPSSNYDEGWTKFGHI